jgi:hypothetical protein
VVLVLVLVVGVALAHHNQLTCEQGGVCTAQELHAMPHERLVELYASRQGISVADTDTTEAVYWTKMELSDCSNWDLGHCTAGDIAGCKAACEQQGTACGGFNTNGWLKKAGCIDQAVRSTTDLYIKSDHVLAPAWPFIWPHPQSFSNGTTRLYLDAENFEFLGPAVADMAAALARYQHLAFPRAPAKAPAKPFATKLVVTVKVSVFIFLPHPPHSSPLSHTCSFCASFNFQ